MLTERDKACIRQSCERCILQHNLTGKKCYELTNEEIFHFKELYKDLPVCKSSDLYPTCCSCKQYPCERSNEIDRIISQRRKNM